MNPSASAAPRPGPRAGAVRRPPLIVRVFTSPVTAGAVERRLMRMFRPAIRAALALAPWAFGLLIVVLAAEMWVHRTPTLEPRHRAEALCFLLAQPPRFTPPMPVSPSVALVKGRYPLGTPPAIALRMAMHFDDPQIVEESTRRVGDFDVASLWLRVPEKGGTRHWLVFGWMEGADLAVCSFRFGGMGDDLGEERRLWGLRLLNRILEPRHFALGSIPKVRMRAEKGESLPHFGPRERR